MAIADNYFCSVQDAEETCEENFKINQTDWIDISNPLSHCQHDIISPIRIKGRVSGKPQWGKFEKLENGEWIDYEFNQK
ncbi:hypothetical protein [Anaerocolumna jejuensis]|uniref:hypothetical protein n=1 Tax=Anaerocolumna jejuensis TaxID=259063 RepID=UPI000932F108|nr:hypothetical protein [Anaerocolumna jejuensis]